MKRCIFLMCLGVSLVFAGHSFASAAVFEISPKESRCIFKLKNIAGDTIGVWGAFRGRFEVSPENVLQTLTVEVDLRSVNTGHTQRDVDLQGPDFFDAAKYPAAKFIAQKIEGEKILGELTFKGKTKPWSAQYTLVPQGNGVVLSAKGVISRKDFALTYNPRLADGSFLLGDLVEIELVAVGISR